MIASVEPPPPVNMQTQAQPAPLPPPFTLDPGRDNNVPDYSQVHCTKMYDKAIAPLEEKCDSTPE